ncbi:MAG: hypothetical protein IJN24_04650 [Bacteroidaceae bacterium]|nr:hypothetical protein [Bacteroidaceae bacterium]
MKRNLFTMALLASTSFLQAQTDTVYVQKQGNRTIKVVTVNETQTSSDSLLVIKYPNEVRISEGNGYIKVEVKGKAGNDAYNYSIEKGYSEEHSSLVKQNSKEWEFNIPFINNNKEEKKESRYKRAKFSFNILDDFQFGMGLASAISQEKGMNVRMHNAGYEFIMNNLISWQYRPTNTTKFSLALGVDWRNYRMKGHTRFIKEGDKLIVGGYPEGADIEFSRLKIFSMTLELMLNQKLFGNVYLGAGPVVNFNTHGSLKTRYTIGEGKEKEGFKETSNNIHQKAITIDLKAELKIKPVGFYVKYSPIDALDTEFGPAFKPFSAGITLTIFD